MSSLAAAALAITITAFAISPRVAAAGSPVHCNPRNGICTVGTGHGSHGGGSSGPGGGSADGPDTCKLSTGEVAPCHDADVGWLDSKDDCYYKPLQPPVISPEQAASQGLPWHSSGDGAYYWATCPGVQGTGGGSTWLPTPPPGLGGVDVWALVQRALKRLPMAPPQIGMSPPAGKPSIVGIYDWLWIAKTPASWGPQSVTAAVSGASVTATAAAIRVVWDMGNGDSVTCVTSGTAWVAGDPGNAASDCSYVYRRRGSFRVTATTTFQVGWVGTGLAANANGATQIRLSSSVPLMVHELQALNTVG